MRGYGTNTRILKFTHLLGLMMCVVTLLSYHLSVVAQDSKVVYSQEKPDTRLVAPNQTQAFRIQVSRSTITRHLSRFSGGNGTLTYSLASTPSLPAWVTFDPTGPSIVAEPDRPGDQSLPVTTFTYIATDEARDFASATFTLTVIDYGPDFLGETIPNIIATQYLPITSMTLPRATYTRPNSHTISPALPAGLTFNTATHLLSGTPRVATPTTTYTYSVLGSGGDSASLTFTITVEEGTEPDSRPVAPTQSQEFIFKAGVPIESGNTLREFTGGNGTITYKLASTPSLPTGLSFNATALRIEGTVPDTSGDDSFGLTSYTYIATDEDGDSTSATFNLCVIDYVPSFVGRTIANITASLDSPFTNVTLPYAWSKSLYGGTQFSSPVLDNQRHSFFNYSLSPSLPLGLTYNPNSRGISGTPTVVSPTTVYTYTAKEAYEYVGKLGSGDSDSLTFTITIEAEADTRPVAPTQPKSFLFYVRDTAQTRILDAFTSGNGTLTYSLASTPSLPDWVTFNPTSLRITVGRDTDIEQYLPRTTYTYIATDEDGDTASATFTLSIFDKRPLFVSRTAGQNYSALSIPNIDVTLNSQISTRLPLAAHGIATPLSVHADTTYIYSLSPGLPAGLTFNPHWRSRLLSGRPTVVTPTTTYTYTATDSAGDSASLTFTITVKAELDSQPVPPTQYQSIDFRLVFDSVSTRTLYAFTGGNGELTYALAPSPDLPPGLSLHPKTRVLTLRDHDKASDDRFSSTVTYTATDEDGDTASDTFTLRIYDFRPEFNNFFNRLIYGRRIHNITATRNSPIKSVTLPYADLHPFYSIGIRTTSHYPYSEHPTLSTYSISPALPKGLTFDPSTRVLSGTPTVRMIQTPYRYTATDSAGDSASISFSITVWSESEAKPDTLPVPPTEIQAFSFRIGARDRETLREFTGGNGDLFYEIASTTPLPDWIFFNPKYRTISVGQDSASDQNLPTTEFTYTATDEDGDTTSATFTITVHDDVPTFATRTIADIVATRSTPIESRTLPAVAYTSGTFSYSIRPYLPIGLNFSSSDRTLSGTPTYVTPTEIYTYTAENSIDETATLTFTITVEADTRPVPPFEDEILTLVLPEETQSNPLRAFTGGNGILTYALAPNPNLPDWITFDPRSRRLRVLYDAAIDQNIDTMVLIYSATDEDGDVFPKQFTLNVYDPIHLFGDRTIPNLVATQHSRIGIVLPRIYRQNFTYFISPSLPSGMTFNARSRYLSGTPNVVTPIKTYTYLATNDRVFASLTFTITVEKEAEPDTQPVAPTQPQVLTFTVGGSSQSRTLEAFTGGNGFLTYALASTPRLPSGLSFNVRTRVISGVIPDNAGDNSVFADTYSYTATDEDGDTVSATFTLAVNDNVPTFGAHSIPDIVARQNSPIISVTLPSASLGTGYKSYLLSPSLPTGLTFNPSTKVISGTPTVDTPTTTYTYIAKDTIGDITSLTFTITVAEEAERGTRPVAPTQSQDLIFTAGVQIKSGNTLRAFIGGYGRLTYTLAATPSLPPGLSFNARTRKIEGIVLDNVGDDSFGLTRYTYTATDEDGLSSSATFTLCVIDYVPSFDGKTIANITATHDLPLTSVTLPYAWSKSLYGGTQFSSPELDNERHSFFDYSVFPALPLGLTYHPNYRAISGTPTVVSPTTTYTYTASEANNPSGKLAGGDSDSLTFTITVQDRVLSFESKTISDITVRQYSPISDLTLPFTTSGTGSKVYSLTPSLPTGLTYNPGSRKISGTPTDITPTTTYTYTATDLRGETASLTFTITVEEGVFDSRPVAQAAYQYLFFNLFLSAPKTHTKTLREFTGGEGRLTYAIIPNPSLPEWISFDPATREITITDTAVNQNFPKTTFTYTATDEDGDTASANFYLRVLDWGPSFKESTIPDMVARQNVYFYEQLPSAYRSGGGLTTYSITPSLPAGLRLSNAGRAIVGTPTVVTPTTTYTYIVTDRDGDTGTLTFAITVEEELDSQPVEPIVTDFVFTPGQVVDEVLPAFTGGDGALIYSLAEGTNLVTTLVGGLSFTPATRTISGTVSSTSNDDSVVATTYTYTAADSDAISRDTASTTFTISIVDELPNFNGNTIADITVLQNTAITSVTLPVTTSGTGTVTYSLTPNLPSGLVFSADDRVLTGTPDAGLTTTVYTYSATDEDGDIDDIVFTITVEPVDIPVEADTEIDTVPIAPAVIAFKFVPGQQVSEILPAFTSGNGVLSYKLKATPALPSGLTFNAQGRILSGTLFANTAGDDSVPTTTYSYTATDEDGDTASASFSIEVLDLQLTPPNISDFTFALDLAINPITLPVFTSSLSTRLTYTLVPLPEGLTFTPATRVLAGAPIEEKETILTYTATDSSGVSAAVTFSIEVMDLPPLEVATTNTLPTLGANIAQVATEAVSSRVELALNGQSQGLDIRTSEGQQFKLNAQNGSDSSGSLARLGLWYSTSDDTLSSTSSALSWNGTTESTNVGLDVGFDLSSKASIVIGVMQNASSTSATYNSGGDSGKLDIDLDSTTFYVGFGYDWLDVWFANGNADSILSDSVRDGFIPTSFAYQTIGLTAAFNFTDGFEVGAKVESLNSALSLSSREALNYSGLESASSQFRTAFFLNYKLDLGREGNAQLIPKFEMGYRGLKQNTSAQGSAPAAGTAAETSFGLDYHHRLLNLTVGFDVRSFEVQDYTSESMQWHIRWESGAYDRGLSLQLKPHSIAESLGGVEALYTSDYSQYQSMLARQYGGGTQATNDDGLDFEMGYGIVAKTGTFTPFVKATNIGAPRGVDSGRRTEEVGLRYEAPTGLDLGLKMEHSFNPESGLSSAGNSSMARESIVTFTTRYNF